MADEEFKTIDDDNLEESSKQKIQIEEDQPKKKSIPPNTLIKYLILVLLLLILIMGVIFTLFYIKKRASQKQNHEVNETKIIKTIKDKELSPKELSKAQKLIQKADKLYKQGEIKEALEIYDHLSHYNKAISFYNIGVAKLKQKKYKEAIESFDASMMSDKLKTPSALNSAVSSLYLEDKDAFFHYLALSQKYLPFVQSSPLYSYYRALINYYKLEPTESLIAILNPTSGFYKDEQNFIASKILSASKNDTQAVNHLKKIDEAKDYLAIGFLQARASEYKLSQSSLQSAVSSKIEPLKSNVALALVKNKLGLLGDSGELLKASYDSFKQKAEETYPIKVELKNSLFDPILAQNEFKKRLFLDDKYRYSLLFYYAPYQLFDASETINSIQKGAKKVEIRDITPALLYLKDSKTISNINIEITKALKNINENKIYKANKILKDATKLYPSHSALYYNLALSYAQIFDFQNAYKYFSRSYSLDLNNYKALAFKAFCARLTAKNVPTKELEKLKEKSDNKEALTLINLALNTSVLNLEYIETNSQIFSHAINLVISNIQNDISIYSKSSYWLKSRLKNDIVSNILYLDSSHNKNDIKAYARAIQRVLNQDDLDLNPLLYGGALPRELYIRMLSIAGISHKAKTKLENHKDIKSVPYLQSLAFANIYNQDFEKSYKIYNELIDDYGQKDSHTLFLASVSAIGAKHYANAVALLELSKLTDPSNFESRYALGLLYQQERNFEGASIQYKKIGNSEFQSDFFTFFLKKVK